MDTAIRPSSKLLVIFLSFAGVSLGAIGYGLRGHPVPVAAGSCLLAISLIFLYFYLSAYVIGNDGLTQRRRLSGVKFVPWEKIGRVTLEQGMLETQWDLGDLRIDDPEGRKVMRWRGVPQPLQALEAVKAAHRRHLCLRELTTKPGV